MLSKALESKHVIIQCNHQLALWMVLDKVILHR